MALMESVIQSDIVALSVLVPDFSSDNAIADFRWVVANKLLKVIAKGQDVTGKRYTDVFPSAHSNGVLDLLRKVFNTGERQEHEVYYDDGIVKGWLRQIYVRLHSYIIVSAEDITESRQAEEERKEKARLAELNERLRAIDQAKTDFFNNVSHEFRTPLTLILGPLREVINDGNLSTAEKEKLQIAARNALRLQKMVNNLLDFSRIEAGKIDAVYQPTDLSSLTAEILAAFRTLIGDAGLKFQFSAGESTQPVYVNRDMWEKIVLNLVSNAFKFTLKGKIQVSVNEMKHRVQLVVKDTGVGIATRNLDRIFERFVRLEGPARTQEGTGIGLALVKELVAIHGGTIKVSSTEGKGSAFVVSLKKGKAHLPKSQIHETPEQLNRKEGDHYVKEAIAWMPEQLILKSPEVDKPEVMIVDDNADMRKYIAGAISDIYKVVLAENGRVALDLLIKGARPALIISDVIMPEIGGYDLVSAIKNNKKFDHIPIILLSARSGEEAIIEGMDTGADDYLEKPFSSRELIAFIKARIHLSAFRKPK
jgi:signal transduction histidine kinase/ActR/RegA family two-component response regulator